MDIEGAHRRSKEPTAVRPELGLGWQESAHHCTGKPAGPRHSTAPDGARRGMRARRGCTGLKAVLRRRLAADRAEPDHDPPLGVVNATFDGTGTIE